MAESKVTVLPSLEDEKLGLMSHQKRQSFSLTNEDRKYSTNNKNIHHKSLWVQDWQIRAKH